MPNPWREEEEEHVTVGELITGYGCSLVVRSASSCKQDDDNY
jgi:hypothetical protein